MYLPKETKRSFGAVNFAAAQLGNQLRTDRLVDLADRFAQHPGGTLPEKLTSPAALKAAYRLMECDAVTHEAVLAPHRALTLERIRQHNGTLLVIHDATELDYTGKKSLTNLGQIGSGHRRGYICQNSLVVDPTRGDVIGLVNQVLHRRAKAPKKETKAQIRVRETRESLLWLKGTAGLPREPRLVDVCDQGADTTEFLEHECQSGRRFVIRSHYDRIVLSEHEGPSERRHLRPLVRAITAKGHKTLKIPAHDKEPARTAQLAIAWTALRVVPPKQPAGKHGREPLPLWIVHVWEPDPPKGVEPVEWFLLSNVPVESLDDALQIIAWYERRWIVEEYHKAMKTGCAIEEPQFTTEARLQPMIALLSVVALTLLSLRDTSRCADAKTRPATDVVAVDYVEVLNAWRHGHLEANLTIHEFFYALARLGGHQNRKNDKQPGWLVLWRGWITLQAMVNGANAIRLTKPGQT